MIDFVTLTSAEFDTMNSQLFIVLPTKANIILQIDAAQIYEPGASAQEIK
jgi:hypothetical protein